MRVLIDTHVLLWWLTDSSRVPARANAILRDNNHECLWSAACTWELAIKSAIGKVRLPDPLSVLIGRILRDVGMKPLCIEHSHAARVADLPPLHRDPFDRMLIAQAQVERIPIVSADPQIAPYGIEVVW